ncbi:ABC transporter permease [Bacillus sp. FSL W8-0445]|jgi:oligopeptide transport system permease protein|uniref:Oligopeptide ABC transporter (Permease) n=6 Tax=Bacillus TaxID=1386 RepID=Q65LC2_BACLD|nr:MULTISPECIES: ABC transporter permease [Bacillus]MBJ7888736.1 ABC transporter permease [Bacillaceae bacterium HSR45]MDP4081439.1 ABC transporter permease [Bacillota bacterium]AAU22796.1 oligopeptide ABC transporter (permease) [Bacillus licheniformis DSM 13 = ATCC 14580]AAU40142.1 oligopeptide ABC transporter permease OppC [Bacillus licheniformis DSM 13 = ATCC 14580]AKQ72428.1 peptide ABC transporter permease [Bacillus licheniformis WX-02]
MQQIPKDMFEPAAVDHSEAEKISKKNLSFWTDVFLRFKENKLALFGLVVLILIALMAIFAPVFSSFQYEETDLTNANQPPSGEHWFGTDDLGRDVFVRTWVGARISLTIGLAAALIDVLIGVIWGAISGIRGGRTDEIMMRIADILWAIPSLLMTILLLVVMGKGLITMIVAMVITGWINMARIVRGQVLQLKNQEFVLASRTLGAKNSRIIRKHLLPNIMSPILVTMTLTVPTAIFYEAFLSYLGLGVPQPLASWGTMATDGVQGLEYYPWRLFFPATFICLTMFAFNVIGDGLRDALDPKLRK